MSLYQIDNDLYALLETGFNAACIDAETGEIDEDKARKYLNDLPIERDKKLEAYGMVIKNYQADIEAIKKEQANLSDRRAAKERQVERLKAAVISSLEMFNQPTFESPKVSFGFRKSEAVNVPDVSRLDNSYVVVKTEYVPDKQEIKKALKSGKHVNGAELIVRKNLIVK